MPQRLIPGSHRLLTLRYRPPMLLVVEPVEHSSEATKNGQNVPTRAPYASLDAFLHPGVDRDLSDMIWNKVQRVFEALSFTLCRARRIRDKYAGHLELHTCRTRIFDTLHKSNPHPGCQHPSCRDLLMRWHVGFGGDFHNRHKARVNFECLAAWRRSSLQRQVQVDGC